MNESTRKMLAFVLLALCQAGFSFSSEAGGGCVRTTISASGSVVVRFSLPENLAVPPWDLDALSECGFSLEKHGSLPYFPVRPIAIEVGSENLSLEVLESKVAEVPDVVSRVSRMRQPSIESDALFAPGSGRPIPLAVFPDCSFPSEHVVADKPITFGKRFVARVKIYPFARDEQRSTFTRADVLVFRISPGQSGARETIPAKPAKRPKAGETESPPPLILNVRSDGIYSIPAKDLFPWWGGDALPLTGLGLTCRGKNVPYHVSGDGDQLLEDGESILFYGVGGDNIFTAHNAYWLAQENEAATMQSRSGPPPDAGSVTHLPRHVRFEQNFVMYEAQPPGTGEDHWFWAKITAPGKAEADIELLNLVDSSGFTCELRVGLQGATGSHITQVSLNGITLLEERWEGLVPKVLQAAFSQDILHEGTNRLTIEELSGDEKPDIVYLDWVDVRYDARLILEEGQLTISVSANTPGIIVSGFHEPNVLVFDVTDPESPEFIEGFVIAPAEEAYQLHLGTMSDSVRRYVVLPSGSAKRADSIRQRSDSNWSGEENRADWIVIAHAEFVDAATMLARHRQSQGLKTAVVGVQDVYDEFNYGVTSPEAIRKLAKSAYENWQAPAPKYLLLFGDGHGDYMDWFGTHQANFVLPHYSWVPPLGWAPDDDWFGCVKGDDGFPEIFVGRIPVRSAGEAEEAVQKITGYDRVAVPQEWQKRVAFCASAGSVFQSICRSIARGAAPNFHSLYLFRDEYAASVGLKEDIVRTLEEGSSLFFYVGHGNVERWSENVLDVPDVPLLANAERLPIMFMLTCLSGYFAVPWKECLAEELLRATNGGVAGCIAPTATGYPSEHALLGQEIVRWLFTGASLGRCLAEAKLACYARGVSESSLRGFVLLGDPATTPRFVLPTPDLIWFY